MIKPPTKILQYRRKKRRQLKRAFENYYNKYHNSSILNSKRTARILVNKTTNDVIDIIVLDHYLV